MSELTTNLELAPASIKRADELFRQHQKEIYGKTDKLFARLMLFQWAAVIAAALVISPRTWSGQTSEIHIHVWAAIFLGGAITIFPVWLTRAWRGTVFTRYVIAVAQMLMSALLISVTGGRIETHFHVFGSLVILSFYRDWRVLIPATVVVALDHFLRGLYWPYSVYGVLSASPWRSIEHAGWVIFEDVFLVISCLRSIKEMRSIANRTAALEASEQNFRQLFQEAPIGMAVIGLDDRFCKANAAFCEMVDYSESELKQRTPFDITHPDDVALSRERAEAMLQSTGTQRIEKRFQRKNGEAVCSTRTGCTIRDEAGKPRQFLIMVEDISERKRTETALHEAKDEADRANRAKSEFLSRMSHELRTPLNAILGFSQLLDRQSPSETQRSRISHITAAGRHLLDLINEVLDISRIEAGRLQLSLEPVSVADAVAEAIDLMRPLAAERAIELSAPAEIDPNLYVVADRQRFKQVLLNLLTNAVKYTGVAGRVAVGIEQNEGNPNLRLIVSDTGAGIAEENLSRLFTPFDRLGAEFSTVQGTGLGLALCQRLMEAMSGTIAVESKLGRGSSFSIELPRTASPFAGQPARKLTSSEAKESCRGDKQLILYIEDNASNLTLIEQILEERSEVELMSATEGRAGLELARRHMPDLILLDLHLPDLPGWDVLAQLQANEATARIPVIVVSADATPGQIKRLMSAGASAYLTKPIDVTEFYRVLETTTAMLKDSVAA